MADEAIHPSAVIEPGARIGAGVRIGPFCVVGPRVRLGDGVELKSHVAIACDTGSAASRAATNRCQDSPPTRSEAARDRDSEAASDTSGSVAGRPCTRR